jgi:poly(3-hydroxybutyrate) depolymerase
MSFPRSFFLRSLSVLTCALGALTFGTAPVWASDTVPPTAPVLAATTTQHTATLSWPASVDNVAVLGYAVTKNGASMGIVSATTLSKTLAYLACGTQYSFGVNAYDTRYNHSATTTILVTTSACGTSAPPSDTVVPSVPTGVQISAASSASFVLSWTASTDNVGVTNYQVSLNGARVAPVSGLTDTLAGLACGTSYPVAVAAQDAAGNVSVAAAATGRTAACSVGGGSGSGSTGLGMASGLSAKTSINSGGQVRKYLTFRPSGLTCGAKGCPLVVYLGGSISSGCRAQLSFDLMMDCDLGTTATGAGHQIGDSGWTSEASRVGAIVLFPEGAPNTCFNNGACTGWHGLTSDDGQFIKDAVQQVETSATVGVSIDTATVYLTGFSGGASATSWIACGSAQGPGPFATNFKIPQSLFAGFGIEAGGQLGVAPTEAVAPVCSWPTVPKPTIITTSKADGTAGYDPAGHQKFVCGSTTPGSTCFVRTPTTASSYIARWGCSALSASTVAAGGSYVSYDHRTYDPCSSPGAAFEWDSLGTGLSVGPPHSLSAYNVAVNIPNLYWTFWTTH